MEVGLSAIPCKVSELPLSKKCWQFSLGLDRSGVVVFGFCSVLLLLWEMTPFRECGIDPQPER